MPPPPPTSAPARLARENEKPALGRNLAGVLDAVLAGIVVLDAEGRVDFANAAASRILEQSSGAVRGEKVESLLGPAHSLARLARGVLASGRSAAEDQCAVERRFEEPLAVDIAASPLVGDDGRVEGCVLFLRDSTLQRNLQQVVVERQALSAFGHIAAGVAHEVRNPLGGIRGAAEILGARAGDERSRDAARLIVREVDRIAELLDGLMAFAQGGALRLAPHNIHQVIDHVIGLVTHDPLARELRIVRAFDPSIPLVWIDADRLTQVFLNIARNAMQALDAKPGSLTITTGMRLDRKLVSNGQHFPSLRIDFSDDGPGIPPELLAQIPTPFFTTRSGGTGLGLALSQHWVVRHDGTLRITSEAGRGTRVRVEIPMRTQP